MMHVADLLPTISSWIGGDCPADIDGIDQSNQLLGKIKESLRKTMVTFWDDFCDTYS